MNRSAKAKKSLSYPSETRGSKLAAEMRKKANKLSAEQKSIIFAKQWP